MEFFLKDADEEQEGEDDKRTLTYSMREGKFVHTIESCMQWTAHEILCKISFPFNYQGLQHLT